MDSHVTPQSTRGPDFSRRQFLRISGTTALAMAASGSIAGFLAACSNPQEEATLDLAAVNSPSGRLRVLGTATYQVDAAVPDGVDLNWGFAGGNEDIIARTQQEGAYDMVTTFHGNIEQLALLGRLATIDTSLIPNWDNVGATFRDSPSIRRDGDVVAIPHHFGYTYTAYNAAETSAPESLSDLMDPALTRRIIVPDDPYAVITTFAIFAGAENPNILTQAEFDEAMGLLRDFRPQLLTVHPYGQEGEIFGRGDAWVGVAESANTVLLMREAGLDANFTRLASWSWWVGFMLLEGAENPAAAYAYMSKALSPDAMRASAQQSEAFPVVDEATDVIDPAWGFTSVDEVLAEAPLQPGVPIEAEGDVVVFEDWLEAWDEFKAQI